MRPAFHAGLGSTLQSVHQGIREVRAADSCDQRRKMRINIYSQELTSEVVGVRKESNTGIVYCAVQMILHSSPMLHHPPYDDDRSAVTFWLPKSDDRREVLAQTFERMAFAVRQAIPGGLD